ncbi:MAG: T9SS type A sorting domain-containing protein [Taibaiella sp.]|nr:T9SS type A sorting domain-containing protein [Taibaiella sp.]
MRKQVLFLVAMIFVCSWTQAQQARSRRFSAPLAGTAKLSEADDKYNAIVMNLEAPDVTHNADKRRLAELKQEVAQKYPRKKKAATPQRKTTAAPTPVMQIGFIADSLSGIPPDNHCAVSNGNKAVAVMNSYITVHDATDGAYLTRKSLYTFSLATGLTNSGVSTVNYRFDPKVIYDAAADKFICVMLNGTNQYNWIVLGFSQTNDPTGSWNFYKLYGDIDNDTTWFDYPAISITNDEFFLTGNKIKYNDSWQAGFRQTVIYQVKKSDGYAGAASLTHRIWDNVQYAGRPIRCLHPVVSNSTTSGPEQYFLSNRNFDVSNDTVFLVKVPDIIGAPDSTLTVTALTADLLYGVPPNALQPDTAKTLATNDGRILGAYKSGDEIQFVSVCAHPISGNAAIYHGFINGVSGSPTVHAEMISNDTLDFGYPNLSFTESGSGNSHCIISYEFSGANMYPGYGAVYYDGSAHSDMLVMKSGAKSINLLSGKEQRWGDYSGSQQDWNEPGAVWVEGIFGRSDSRYGNFMAKLTTPSWVKTPEVANANPRGRVFPNPAWEIVSYEFTIEKAQSFSFALYDMSGRLVDKVLDTYCKKGHNLVRLNVATLPAGTYLLRATGAEGEVVDVHQVIRH